MTTDQTKTREMERPMGDPQMAATELMETLGLGKGTVEAAENTAHTLYNYAHYEEAEQVLEGVLVLDEQRHYPHLLLGDIAYRREDWERAREHLERALELDPEDLATLSKLGETCLRQGDDERAREVLARAVAHANRFSHHRRRAQALYRRFN